MVKTFFSITMNGAGLHVSSELDDLPTLDDEFKQLVWLVGVLEHTIHKLEEKIEGHPDWIPENERE